MVNDLGRFHKYFNAISTAIITGYETRCRKTSTIVKTTERLARDVNKASYVGGQRLVSYSGS
jgi:hypothetical protein